MTDTKVSKEIEEQLHSYFELCAMYEKTPSVLGFAEHLVSAYEEM